MTLAGAAGSSSLIDEIVREGARRMLAEALQAEVDAYIARFAAERDEHGRRLVVRNGSHQPREVLTSAGAVEVVAPRVNDRRIDPDTGERRRFSSAILPPWCRKTPKITEVLPLLYLHGLSSGDFVPALGQFLGLGRAVRAGDHEADRDLEGRAARVRGPGSVQCGLRLPVGRRHPRQHPPGGAQAVPAGPDRRARRRPQGARRAGRRLPGVGRVLGGPAARLRPPRDARPGARGRRRRARVLGRAARGLPATPGAALLVPQDRQRARCATASSAHPGAKKALAEIWNAEDKRHALAAVRAFEAAYGAKFAKAVAKITDDLDELLAFYDYPAEHWIHLRTTNPIESTFATVRHRTKITRGPGSRAAGLAMAFKLIEAAQDRWRAVNAPTSSRSSAPAPRSTTANSSNDPTNTPNPKPPKRSSSTGLDDCSRSSIHRAIGSASQ